MTTNSKKQMLNDYKSGLPDFLLSFVDSIIKFDRSQILRYNFLHYTVDELLREDVPPSTAVCLFYDPEGVNHIFIEDIRSYPTQFPFLPPQSFNREHWTQLTPEMEPEVKYSCHPYLLKYFTESQLQSWSKLEIITLDQVRCRCLANIYMEPEEVITDIYKVLSWNQIFRVKSANSFIYLTLLLESFTSIINKKKFHKRFAAIKAKDFQKLLMCELRFKVNFQCWPYIPDKFRQYQEIDHYAPTPEKRAQFIEKRIQTKKLPVECPENCVCYSDLTKTGRQFCRYTLKDGWVSECPNRVNKIQCNHADEEKMKRCRNAEIKKSDRKKCRTNEDDQNSNNQIQECIMWGLDLYTRNVIFHSLPEVDLLFKDYKENKQNKNQFIEQSLLKAINSNGVLGYELRQACNKIIAGDNHRQFKDPEKTEDQSKDSKVEGDKKRVYWSLSAVKQNAWQQGNQNMNEQSNNKLVFKPLDRFYAKVLLRNYEYCYKNIDKTAFRIHTKGKGARCIAKQGIKQGSFLIEYFGELYEPWRWYEREDFIKEVMKKKKLKNYIPEFYNIYLEHHKDDPEGYDLMVVDPNKKGNFSSRFSHSCSPNCGTVTTISDGKYFIGMYSFRDIQYGEELTFDYCCMTESNYEHTHSICLCGTQKCRGNYLQLANSRTFSQLVDKNTCFLSRNSLILQALQPVTQSDIKLCSDFNIKERMLADSPDWIKKWTANLLKYIEAELAIYKSELVDRWTKQYPWQPTTAEIQEANIELYSQTSKNDLFVLRFQNLFTTVDKMKYFLNTIESKQPPLYFLDEQQILEFMVGHKESILKEIEEVMIEQLREREAFLIKKFIDLMAGVEQPRFKLFFFRLCCLCVSHMCLFIQPTKRFNSHLLADIIYFYSFTHTYFTANQYKSTISEQIKLTLMEITGKPSDAKVCQKIKRRYSSQFVWGQLVSWYKQTIVNPQASLSQDRRGTLSYPMIKSTVNSKYPFEKHCRKNFIKALRQKSANSWPCAPEHGCLLSFRNPFKCYGTVFFQNVHNADKFKDFPGGNLLDNVLNTINSKFEDKIKLFKNVESQLSGISQLDECYDILTHIQAKYFSFTEPVPPEVPEQAEQNKKENKSKRRKGREKQSTSKEHYEE